MRTDILKAALFTPISGGRWGLPLLCWGEPGVAKTAVIEEVANRYRLPTETLSPSERGEGAFGVVPVPDKSGSSAYMLALATELKKQLSSNADAGVALERAMKKVGKSAPMTLTYPRPEWTEKFDDTGRGVVFVDEATSTPPALQAPLMGLILARRIGGYILPAGVRVIAAANPTDIAAGGFDLAAPVANRMGHVDWHAPSIDEHAAFMMRGNAATGSGSESKDDADVEEKRVLEAWSEAWAKAVGIETAFLRARPSLKNQCPKAGDPKASRGWPSDRSWEAATRALASAEVHNLDDESKEIFVASFIGEGPAGELFAFAQKQDLPDPAAVLDGKVQFKHAPSRLDRTVAVLSSCTSLITPANAQKRQPRSKAMWELLETMTSAKMDLDILVPSVQALIEANLHGMTDAAKVLAQLQPILKAANIRPGR